MRVCVLSLLCCILVVAVAETCDDGELSSKQQLSQHCDAVVDDGSQRGFCSEQQQQNNGDVSLLLNEQGRNVVLVGMMGSGKTTTGKLLAEQLGYEFVDTDEFIETQLGVSIGELFAQGKEQEFRQAEHDALKRLSKRSKLVIATGGGAVVRDDNWEYLGKGVVVYLNMTAADIVARLQSDEVEISKRPLLARHANPQAALEKLMQARQPMYRKAAATVDVGAGDRKEDVLRKAIAAIEKLHVA